MTGSGREICPNCGTNLKRFDPVQLGSLGLDHHEIRWRGALVSLTGAQRLLVSSVARANGRAVALWALAEAIGVTEESVDREAVVRTQLGTARRAFRDLDPDFCALETVFGAGVRWSDTSSHNREG